MKTILVLGATSGIAQAFCREALTKGYQLVLAGRHEDKLKTLARDLEARHEGVSSPTWHFDMAKTESHEPFVAEITQKFPSLEGCFVAAAVMETQEDYDTSWAACEETIACNYTGTISIIRCLAKFFKERHKGWISCITSVAGDRGRKSNYLYGSTKAGLNAYLSGLRNDLNSRNVFVQTVKAGPVDTRMSRKAHRAPLVVSAQYAAKRILKSIEARKDVVYIPWFWRPIMFVIRAIPERIFKKLSL